MKLWIRRAIVFLITYLAYMTIHIVRKPSSVLKSVLHPQGSYDEDFKPGWAPFNQDLVPSRVAEVGFRVSGAFRETENGLYECTAPLHDLKDGFCSEFRQHDKGLFAIRRHPGAFCKKFVQDLYEGNYCWVLEVFSAPASLVTRRKRETAPLYAQLSDGELPEPLRNGDAHLEDKAWRRFNGRVFDYVAFSKLRVTPNIQDGKVLLGLIDTIFLLAYTTGLFVSGWIADRVDIRKFLSLGMFSSGLSSIFLGLGHRFGVHSLSYFLVVSAWGGLSQSVGWPCVVAVMGRYYPRAYRARGLIMGMWSTNLSVGNILGSVITTACVSWGMSGEDWPLGFEVPGYIVIACGVLVFLLLEPEPRAGEEQISQLLDESLLPETRMEIEMEEDDENDGPAPTLSRALMIPGVVPFALCLCFAKMGQYALLFWGPYYLQIVGFSSEKAGYLCSFFDVGGLLGGIACGWLSDRLGGKRGLTAGMFLFIASITLFLYYNVTSHSGTNIAVNVAMMILVGFWVNGPVSLITTAVSQDLGNHPSLNGDERLIASVAGIIDGTGSFGAAMQGILIGVISTSSWHSVFNFLIVCCLLACSLLGGVIKREMFT